MEYVIGGHFTTRAVEASIQYLRRAMVPEPVRGGTFFYCPWQERETLSGGRVDHHSCGVLKPGWATGTRFRTAAAYRRHYRRHHGLRLAGGGMIVHGQPLLDEAARAGSGPSWPEVRAELDAEALREQVNTGIRRRFGGG